MLALWAAVVAERLGFARDEALTLGKAVAGLNAQSKGRALGIFTPAGKVPEIDRGCRTAALGCVDCKGILSENLVLLTQPIYERRIGWEKRRDELDDILEAGCNGARVVTEEVMQDVREAMNLNYGKR